MSNDEGQNAPGDKHKDETEGGYLNHTFTLLANSSPDPPKRVAVGVLVPRFLPTSPTCAPVRRQTGQGPERFAEIALAPGRLLLLRLPVSSPGQTAERTVFIHRPLPDTEQGSCVVRDLASGLFGGRR